MDLKAEMTFNFNKFLKSRKDTFLVIPAKAGIQSFRGLIDSGFRRSDWVWGFLGNHLFCLTKNFILNLMKKALLFKIFRIKFLKALVKWLKR